jgi:hypothetical protein
MQNETQDCWYNEREELITLIPKEWQVHRWFFCSKCLRISDTLEEAKRHRATCNLIFSKVIFQKDGLSIAGVTPNSPEEERLVCEQASSIEQIEDKWQQPMLRPDNWVTKQFTSQCFVLLKDLEFVALVVIRKGVFPHEGGRDRQQTIVANFFTLCNYRKQGHAKMLLFQALDYLGENCNSVRFLGNFSQNGRQFILFLTKSFNLKTVKTVPVELSSQFDE